MTSSTYHPPMQDREVVDTAKIASAVLATVAYRMQLTQDAVKEYFAQSGWNTIAQMIEREFIGTYRGYFPKCGMEIRAEAVIAEVFDQLAMAFDNPRRAVRSGVWTPPAALTGGRSNG